MLIIFSMNGIWYKESDSGNNGVHRGSSNNINGAYEFMMRGCISGARDRL